VHARARFLTNFKELLGFPFKKFKKLIVGFFIKFFYKKTMVNGSQRRLFGFLRFIGQTYIYPILIYCNDEEKKTINKWEFFQEKYFICIHIL
jgi:hypothetical protein